MIRDYLSLRRTKLDCITEQTVIGTIMRNQTYLTTNLA